MSQQDLNAFADWLVANQSKKGTPEYDTVAKAFSELDNQPQDRDGPFARGIDNMQKMVGKGIEVGGRLIGSDTIADYGTRQVQNQDRDIAQGGYQPQYPGSLRENYNQGTFFPALGEKLLETAPTGGAAIAGGAAVAAGAVLGAPAWLTFGAGAAVTGGTMVMATGESALDTEEKTGSYDPKIAASIGALVGFLDKFGAGKVIPINKLATMTGGEVAEELTKQGFGEAAKAFTKRVGKAAGGEGLTETAQDAAVMAGTAVQGGDFTGTEVADRLTDSFALGSSMGGGTRAAIDTTTAAAQGIKNVATSPKISNDSEAAADFARDLKELSDTQGYDINDVNTGSEVGARAAIDDLHSDYGSKIDFEIDELKSRLKIDDADPRIEALKKVQANNAKRKAKNKVKSRVDPRDFEVIEELTAGTEEGASLLSLMRKSNELSSLANKSLKGGLSQYFDFLNPLDTDGRYNIGRTVAAPISTLGAYGTYGASLVPAVAGRAVDAMTGRRSRVARYVRENQANPGIQVPTEPSLRDQDQEATANAERDALRVNNEERQTAEFLDSIDAPPSANPNNPSPQAQLEDATGFDKQTAIDVAAMIGNSNFYPEAIRRFATDYIASVRQGGSVGKTGEGGLGSLIRLMNRLADSDPDNYPRANPQNQLAIQAAGGGGPTIMTRAAMQREQGRADNQAFNKELQAAVNADTSIDKQTKALVLEGLNKALKTFAGNPVEAVEAIYLDVATRAKNPQYADQYIMPYVERVTAQQQQQAATEQPAATEAPSGEPEINRMAVPAFGEGLNIFPKTKALYSKIDGIDVDQGNYQAGPNDVTGNTYGGARVSIGENGRGRLEVDPNQAASPDKSDGKRWNSNLVRPNLYEWTSNPDNRQQSFIVTVEQGPTHFYTLQYEADVPTELYRKPLKADGTKADEPTMRPRGFGNVVPGRQIGTIKLKSSGKEHPIYDTIRIEPNAQVNRMSGPNFDSPALATNDVFNIGNDYAMTNLDIRPSPDQVASMRDGSFKPETKRSLVEAAQLLQDRYEAATGSNQPLDLSEDNIERIATLMATEAAFNLDQDGNAIGWYDRKLKAAKAVVTLVEPRVMQSPEAEQAFDFALAVTSNGQAVADNFAYALEVFRQFMDTGVMPTTTFKKGGERNTSMVAAFDFFNRWNESGQNETIGDFLNTDFTVRELTDFIARFNEANGTEVSVPSSEGMAENVKASYILGPKIGQGFYQNIRGNYDPLTMDIWWMRMWNRLVGRPFEDLKTDEVMQKNRDKIERGMKDTSDQAMKKVINDALKAAGVNRTGLYKDPAKFDQFITQLNKTYQKFYKNYKAENGVNHTKPALFKAVGTHIKNMSEQLQAQPKGPGERSYMRKATKRAIELLQEQGYDINTADFQALMWYPEKQLFRLLGVAPGRGADNDYLDAAKLLAEKEGKSYDQIQEALPAAERDGINPESSTPGQDGVIRPGTRGTDAAEEGGILRQDELDFGGTGDNGRSRAEPGAMDVTPLAGSREPTPTEVEEVSRPVKAIFEIGKKGSPYENGIRDYDTVQKLAQALNHTFHLVTSTTAMAKAVNIPYRKAKGSQGLRVTLGSNPDTLKGRIGVVKSKNKIFDMYVALHELGHALESSYVDEQARQEGTEILGRDFYSPGKQGVINDPQHSTYSNTFRAAMRELMALYGDQKISTGDLTNQDARDIVDEIIRFQRSGVVEGFGTKSPIRRDYSRGAERVALGIMTRGEVDAALGSYERSYFQTPYEMAADLLGVYMLDPALAKREMPKAAKLARLLLKDNPTIQLFSAPLSVVLSMVMANMLIAEREEEEKKMPPPGALSLGQAPGALSI